MSERNKQDQQADEQPVSTTTTTTTPAPAPAPADGETATGGVITGDEAKR